ncbi:MAG: dihydrodipicolinate reductase [Acidobacteria bacterium]|nr:dihydrodipicolinate reductase [Acidobacteriota bacterium]
MKIAIIGYGKMGRMVEDLALRQGWEIGPRLDVEENRGGSGITRSSMAGVDVAIEFSQPDAVMDNIEAGTRAGIHMVVGTTGWFGELERARQMVLESGTGLIYGSNFSVGMNLFFQIAAEAARIVGRLPQYDAFLSEAHHRAKKDAPSGTALSLLEIIRPHLGTRKPGIAVTRAGCIPGNHAVGFDSEADTIILEHRARNRQGLAEGAILAARWIAGRKGFYEFRSVFAEIAGLVSA